MANLPTSPTGKEDDCSRSSLSPPPPPPWYQELTTWITNHGGTVHQSLTVDVVDEQTESRGIRATAAIEEGEVLIRLPAHLAVDGRRMPEWYTRNGAANGGGAAAAAATTTTAAVASPWLRCLASLLSAKDKSRGGGAAASAGSDDTDFNFAPYLNSLPASYDTLLDETCWTDDDVSTFLAGTALGRMVKEDRKHSALRQRFEHGVLPYLRHVGLWNGKGAGTKTNGEQDDGRFDEFKSACACISTRGFHLSSSSSSSSSSSPAGGAASSASTYSGPYLLPFIDLLNHSTSDRCTTLRRDRTADYSEGGGGAFVMVAERRVAKGEEILHSYGDGLTSAQLLQTFGFVGGGAVRRAADGAWTGRGCESSSSSSDVTPAVLSRDVVWKACISVAESTYPKELRQIMRSRGLTDETWELDTNAKERGSSSHVRELIPDDALVTPETPLSDELVTLSCLPFLPGELYEDWTREPCLWTEHVLEDYYLGKLALRSLLGAIDAKLAEYSDIDASTLGLASKPESTTGLGDDALLLSSLLAPSSSDAPDPARRQRAMFGLAIRLEEKHCLRLLRREVIGLDDYLDDEEEKETEECTRSDSKRVQTQNGGGGGGGPSSKRIKL